MKDKRHRAPQRCYRSDDETRQHCPREEARWLPPDGLVDLPIPGRPVAGRLAFIEHAGPRTRGAHVNADEDAIHRARASRRYREPAPSCRPARSLCVKRIHQQVYPPSTTTTLPVIRLAASDARKRTTAATSSISPSRAIGVPPIHAAYSAGFDLTKALSDVLM